MKRGQFCPGCDQPFDGVHLAKALRPVGGVTVTVAPQADETPPCPHGRPHWRTCPHCNGVNAPDPGEVREP